jgi:single-strand DNA-binding protein
MSINRVNISGNLTRDPDLRSTSNGTQVLTLGVAVNDRRRNPSRGEWVDYPNYVECVVFGARADALSRYLTKGTKVAIEGKLRYSSWERDGQKRSKLEVIVDEIEFMSSRQGGQAQSQSQAQNQAQNQMQNQAYVQPQQPQNSGYMPQQPQQQNYGQPAYSTPQQMPQSVPDNNVFDADIPF